MLYLRDVSGNEEPIQPTSATLTNTLNQIAKLDVSFLNNGLNEAAAGMLQPRTLLVDSTTGEQYRIQTTSGANVGDYRSCKATFLGVLHDWNDHYIESVLTGSQSLDSCMKLITANTGVTYAIHDNFDNYSFSENFGGGKGFDLFLNTLMSDFGFEWSYSNAHVDIYKKVGKDKAFVWLDNLDLFSLSDQGDFTAIATHIKGTGKMDENQHPQATADYTSPNAAQWGIIDADPVSDERFTDNNSLLDYLKTKIQDTPQVQRTATLNQFDQNTPRGKTNDGHIGNYGYIRDRNGVDVLTRVSETSSDLVNPESKSVTFGNLDQSFTQIMAGLKTAHDDSGKTIESLKNEAAKWKPDIAILPKVGEVDD
ncbi:phage tail protein [Furfurilactobacillus entadae]|uniref:phage tail protein n=1 Tax=Furfurilactobacillus entadae TaxID=2922307 RepID=UPI0035EFFDF9